ncbi:flippase-like domain-containing protein [Aquisalimonas sp. 2447]|uniref:lysylphosphatidylglycerol synthase transmembrane domain-containing protein n=1 Tax=Aquisalimonas sp. 2447 TaxID=2740807 RepID=UPI001432571B|nr:lysylphosphatidylglycerol synthase transmembrane domain-containing protein [Aquisalimonas sp. 2447]QIT56721.1 flippase-like domain-containing protein [Aquisalimonas sp. 2447]
MTPRSRLLLRMTVSIGLLAAVAMAVDPASVVRHLGSLHPGWVLAALALSAVQLALSAWRWHFTAHRLGLRLRWAAALREYLLGSFVNQVLPGGVIGDASRAWRHARETARTGPAIRAVILERGSGQLVMALVAVPAVFALAGWAPPLLAWSAATAFGLILLATSPLLPAAPADNQPGIRADLRRALLSPGALPLQLIGSALVVATYLGVFLAAGRAIGATLPALELMALVPPVLLAMLIPITIAGWGLREGAAATVWAAAGHDPAEGAAIAVAYGLLVLVATLPGALCFRAPRRTPTTG